MRLPFPVRSNPPRYPNDDVHPSTVLGDLLAQARPALSDWAFEHGMKLTTHINHALIAPRKPARTPEAVPLGPTDSDALINGWLVDVDGDQVYGAVQGNEEVLLWSSEMASAIRVTKNKARVTTASSEARNQKRIAGQIVYTKAEITTTHAELILADAREILALPKDVATMGDILDPKNRYGLNSLNWTQAGNIFDGQSALMTTNGNMLLAQPWGAYPVNAIRFPAIVCKLGGSLVYASKLGALVGPFVVPIDRRGSIPNWKELLPNRFTLEESLPAGALQELVESYAIEPKKTKVYVGLNSYIHREDSPSMPAPFQIERGRERITQMGIASFKPFSMPAEDLEGAARFLASDQNISWSYMAGNSTPVVFRQKDRLAVVMSRWVEDRHAYDRLWRQTKDWPQQKLKGKKLDLPPVPDMTPKQVVDSIEGALSGMVTVELHPVGDETWLTHGSWKRQRWYRFSKRLVSKPCYAPASEVASQLSTMQKQLTPFRFVKAGPTDEESPDPAQWKSVDPLGIVDPRQWKPFLKAVFSRDTPYSILLQSHNCTVYTGQMVIQLLWDDATRRKAEAALGEDAVTLSELIENQGPLAIDSWKKVEKRASGTIFAGPWIQPTNFILDRDRSLVTMIRDSFEAFSKGMIQIKAEELSKFKDKDAKGSKLGSVVFTGTEARRDTVKSYLPKNARLLNTTVSTDSSFKVLFPLQGHYGVDASALRVVADLFDPKEEITLTFRILGNSTMIVSIRGPGAQCVVGASAYES